MTVPLSRLFYAVCNLFGGAETFFNMLMTFYCTTCLDETRQRAVLALASQRQQLGGKQLGVPQAAFRGAGGCGELNDTQMIVK